MRCVKNSDFSINDMDISPQTRKNLLDMQTKEPDNESLAKLDHPPFPKGLPDSPAVMGKKDDVTESLLC
ncbi:MAG: hypothetical protein R6X10_10695 [Desulfobacterales bacterium]